MPEVRITLPEGLTEALKMTKQEFENEARLILAAKLFEMGRVSAGMAARIAGVDKVTFLHLLHKYGVPAINLKGEEVEREIEAARELGG